MISINCGFNFDPELPTILDKANREIGEKTGIRITEVYGSVPGIGLGSVRQKSRLRATSLNQVMTILTDLRDRDIEFNYTVNRSVIRTLRDLGFSLGSSPELAKLDYLVKSELITRLTICHPLLMEVFSERYKLPIEISTVTQVMSPSQMRKLKERAPTIDKICMHLYSNRNFPLLREFVDVGKKLGIRIELLLNEFCSFQCPDRKYCYDLQSIQTYRETEFDTYPHGRCIKDRNDPVEWLKARFILPQWFEDYRMAARIKNYKLTGRTHPTKYIERVARIYLSGEYDGNLLDLWAHLENIEREGKPIGPKFFIPSKGLKFDSFIKNSPFCIGDDMKGFYCDLACGSCTYCERYLEKIGYQNLR